MRQVDCQSSTARLMARLDLRKEKVAKGYAMKVFLIEAFKAVVTLGVIAIFLIGGFLYYDANFGWECHIDGKKMYSAKFKNGQMIDIAGWEKSCTKEQARRFNNWVNNN